jgi:excisionase family DNA binding protein
MEQSEVVQMPVLFRPEEVAKSRAFGRTAVFELIRTGELRSVKLGKSRRIPAEACVRGGSRCVGRLSATAGEGSWRRPDVGASGSPRPMGCGCPRRL